MYTILHRSYGRRCRARREKQILELVVKAVCVNTTSDLSARPVISAADVVWQASSAGSSIYCIVPSAHRHTVVLNTARDLLDTNQTHQRVVLHNVTQVMTCCCPVKIIASIPDELIAWTANWHYRKTLPPDVFTFGPMRYAHITADSHFYWHINCKIDRKLYTLHEKIS